MMQKSSFQWENLTHSPPHTFCVKWSRARIFSSPIVNARVAVKRSLGSTAAMASWSVASPVAISTPGFGRHAQSAACGRRAAGRGNAIHNRQKCSGKSNNGFTLHGIAPAAQCRPGTFGGAHPSLSFRRRAAATRGAHDENGEVEIDAVAVHSVEEEELKPPPSSVLSDVNTTDTSSEKSNKNAGFGGGRFVAACTAAFALALAGLAVPLTAQARRAPPAPAAAAATSTHAIESMNPNLIQLPEGVRKALDDVTLEVLKVGLDSTLHIS
jgi:hypothetical protein